MENFLYFLSVSGLFVVNFNSFSQLPFEKQKKEPFVVSFEQLTPYEQEKVKKLERELTLEPIKNVLKSGGSLIKKMGKKGIKKMSEAAYFTTDFISEFCELMAPYAKQIELFAVQGIKKTIEKSKKIVSAHEMPTLSTQKESISIIDAKQTNEALMDAEQRERIASKNKFFSLYAMRREASHMVQIWQQKTVACLFAMKKMWFFILGFIW